MDVSLSFGKQVLRIIWHVRLSECSVGVTHVHSNVWKQSKTRTAQDPSKDREVLRQRSAEVPRGRGALSCLRREQETRNRGSHSVGHRELSATRASAISQTTPALSRAHASVALEVHAAGSSGSATSLWTVAGGVG